MRDILFRGKRMDNGEWIFGYYFQNKNPLSEDGLPVKHCISDIPPFGAKVYPETVGQYTGLEDKNGRKIFDGDILELDGEDGFFKLEYKDDTAMFVMIGDYFMVDFDNFWNREVEVIGNIYDHPELMGGDEDGEC